MDHGREHWMINENHTFIVTFHNTWSNQPTKKLNASPPQNTPNFRVFIGKEQHIFARP